MLLCCGHARRSYSLLGNLRHMCRYSTILDLDVAETVKVRSRYVLHRCDRVRSSKSLRIDKTRGGGEQQPSFTQHCAPAQNHPAPLRPPDHRPCTPSRRQAALQVLLREGPEEAPGRVISRVSWSYFIGVAVSHPPCPRKSRGGEQQRERQGWLHDGGARTAERSRSLFHFTRLDYIEPEITSDCLGLH